MKQRLLLPGKYIFDFEKSLGASLPLDPNTEERLKPSDGGYVIKIVEPINYRGQEFYFVSFKRPYNWEHFVKRGIAMFVPKVNFDCPLFLKFPMYIDNLENRIWPIYWEPYKTSVEQTAELVRKSLAKVNSCIRVELELCVDFYKKCKEARM